MNYTVERLEGKVKFAFSLDKQEWDKAIDGAYKKNASKYSVQGFRKGHVPRKVIENMYGPSVFFEDAFNGAFPDIYSEALEKEPDIYPVESPDIEFDTVDEMGITFTATVTVKPEVKLGAYKGLKITKADASVSDTEVDQDIVSAQERAGRKVAVTDRAVLNGDFVTLDYSGSVDGAKFKGGTAEKQELEIGSGSFIPGFEEQVIGLKIGESKDIKVKFPEEYHAKELKGKDAVFAVTVHEIKVKELPKLDDEFAKDVSAFDTFKEYREDVRKRLTESKQKRADNEDENNLVQEIAKLATVEVPQCMIDTQLDYMLREFEYRLMYQGMKLEDYFKYTKSTKEDFFKDRQEDAKQTVKTRLTVEAIVKAEGMKVEDAEAELKIADLSAKAEKSAADYKKDMDPRQMEQIKSELLTDKLLDFLKANNTFVKADKKAKKDKEDEGAQDKTAVKKPKAAK